jgi:hypothetical protein
MRRASQKVALQYRMTELSGPKDKSVQIAYENKFPQTLDFNNPLSGVLAHKRDTSFNFVMASGEQTEFPCLDIELTELRIPEGAVVRKIRLREF